MKEDHSEQTRKNNALMLKMDREREAAARTRKTIWNSDGTDGPVLICAPTFEDIQRMAGFPQDREGYAIDADSAEDFANRESVLRDEGGEPYAD